MKERIISGLILAILGYVLSIASEATQDTAVIASYVTGGFELIFYLISIPLVYSAEKKYERKQRRQEIQA